MRRAVPAGRRRVGHGFKTAATIAAAVGIARDSPERITAGQVELIVQGKDGAGNPALSATSIWVTKQGELWFAQDNDDRMDVLPEKKRYEPGETARLQVRMPFREAMQHLFTGGIHFGEFRKAKLSRLAQWLWLFVSPALPLVLRSPWR